MRKCWQQIISFFVGFVACLMALQVTTAQAQKVLAEQRIWTDSGEKNVVAYDDHRLEIFPSNRNQANSPYQYRTVDNFLYMVPLGAADHPDRMLTVWEGPTTVTHVVVFLLEDPASTSSPPTKGRNVVLDTGSFGLPSILYVRDAEILILSERGQTSKEANETYLNRVLIWNGEKYLDRGSVTTDRLWSKLNDADIFIQHRNDTQPVIVKP